MLHERRPNVQERALVRTAQPLVCAAENEIDIASADVDRHRTDRLIGVERHERSDSRARRTIGATSTSAPVANVAWNTHTSCVRSSTDLRLIYELVSSQSP